MSYIIVSLYKKIRTILPLFLYNIKTFKHSVDLVFPYLFLLTYNQTYRLYLLTDSYVRCARSCAELTQTKSWLPAYAAKKVLKLSENHRMFALFVTSLELQQHQSNSAFCRTLLVVLYVSTPCLLLLCICNFLLCTRLQLAMLKTNLLTNLFEVIQTALDLLFRIKWLICIIHCCGKIFLNV